MEGVTRNGWRAVCLDANATRTMSPARARVLLGVRTCVFLWRFFFFILFYDVYYLCVCVRARALEMYTQSPGIKTMVAG